MRKTSSGLLRSKDLTPKPMLCFTTLQEMKTNVLEHVPGISCFKNKISNTNATLHIIVT